MLPAPPVCPPARCALPPGTGLRNARAFRTSGYTRGSLRDAVCNARLPAQRGPGCARPAGLRARCTQHGPSLHPRRSLLRAGTELTTRPPVPRSSTHSPTTTTTPRQHRARRVHRPPRRRRRRRQPGRERAPREAPEQGPRPPHGLTWRAGAAPPSCCPPRRARSW